MWRKRGIDCSMRAFHNKNSNWDLWSKIIVISVLDVLSTLFCYFFALLLRFDFVYSSLPDYYVQSYLGSIWFWCLVNVCVFYLFRLYHSIWSYAGLAELWMIIKAYLVLIPVYAAFILIADLHMPRSYYLMGYLLNFCATTAIRFSYRFFRVQLRLGQGSAKASKLPLERVMVIGAGAAGQMLIKDMQSSDKMNTKVVCAIDDNPAKLGRLIEGVEIVGNRNDIVNAAKRLKITHIVYAIPSSSMETRREILNLCKMTNCKLQTIPGLYQLLNDEVRVSQLRDVEVSDLLGREQVQVNNEEILRSISGKVVMVTGGGGSIGSELCRQIAQSNPKQLIIFDIYENNAYAIQQELLRKYPQLNLQTLIGSVRNTGRVNELMRRFKPDIVFHAAAHKHVPLMEDSPNEAIKNNVIGTYKTATAAARYGVGKFVLISTDKAVNPTNIMGASKRLCEMVVQMMDRQCPDTSFAVVRFGNVLGSNGSVIPLFKKQIAEGGPVTVTDKRVIRYFMTIPEAVSLVLQAAYYAVGGEIFVLEMGEPVKIDDMARNLIRLSGFTPDEDIKIVYTGLRPGEKLYEELLMNEEGLQETANKLIHIGMPIQMDDAWFRRKLSELDLASRQESNDIRALVAEIVPTYHYTPQDTGAQTDAAPVAESAQV